ncbi:MAG: pilin [Pseudomonadota bacterium]|nr:pilin [Pseudomonadota bacterium]
MRPQILLLVGAAALFVVGGFLLMRGSQRDDVQDVRTARIADDTGKLAKSTAVVAEATKQLSGAVRQSDERIDQLESETSDLRDRVETVEEHIVTRQSAIAGSFIASDFARVGSAKVAISEAFMTNGVAPNSNAEAGLPVPADLRGQSLREMHVRYGGKIEMIYDQRSGVDGGVISLIPDLELAMRSGMINWRCETSDYPDISKFMPGCQYVGKL